jgi:hypothetical protein
VSGLEHGGLARSIRVEGGTMMLEIGLPEFDDALLKELLAYPFMAVEVDSVWRQQVGGQPCPVHFFDSPRHTVDASE